MREVHGFLFIISWLLLGSITGGYLLCQNPGMKYSRDFSINDYSLQQQNWWIAQDQTGFIYVANQGGILKYDGVSWDIIKIPNTTARSFRFLYQRPGRHGGLSIRNHLKKERPVQQTAERERIIV